MRDTPAIRSLDLPVYHRVLAATYGRLHMPLDHQVPIACAGVTVMPGDVVVGDGEGVVVVPAALVAEVAADAAEQELEEEWALERVAAGESTVGVFPIAADRRAEFEAWRPNGRHASTNGGRHGQRSIEIEGFHHANPIPAALSRSAGGVERVAAGTRAVTAFPRMPSRRSPTCSTTSTPCCARRGRTGVTSSG